MLNGLSQTLLKLACPGVPDFYQGSETWDMRLVDPDNRSPVCFHALDSQLAQIREIALRHDLDELETLVTRWQDGRIKVHLIQSALAFRRARAQLFENGTFDALTVAGEHAKRAFAFRRSTSEESVVVVIPRVVASLKAPLDRAGRSKFWRDTSIALPGDVPSWVNVLAPGAPAITAASGKVSLGDVFEKFPVALLTPAA